MSEIPVLDADPYSTDFFENPWPVHALVRETGTVVRMRRHRCLAIGRHADIVAVMRDWETFVSSRGVGLRDYHTSPPLRGRAMILETDPPEHTHRRRVLERALSPAAVRALRPGFEAAAAALVERLVDAREVDAVSAIAEAYPLAVFPDALGMEMEGRENLLPFGNFTFNTMGPDNDLLAASLAELPPLAEWATRQSQRERLRPGSIGMTIHEAADRGEISSEEAPLLVRALLSAGVDTTVNGIAAALSCFLDAPDQWTRLQAAPALARGAFEEAVRHETPVQVFLRTTARPTEIGGVPVPADTKVMMFLGAANRDPRRWEDPDRFDIGRNAAGHVGFGAGIHMCVGQVVARLEGEAVLAALARRVARIELAGRPVRRHNNSLRGLASLPVRLYPA
jgi:cytochrome P450